MKIIKGIISVILVLIMMSLEAAIVFLLSIRNLTTVEGIAESIQEIDVVDEILVDEKKEETETATKIYDILGQINISKGDANIILKDKDFKKVVSEFISTATLHQFNEKIAIKYPSVDDITNVIYNNFDALKESYQLDINKEDISKEMIHEEVEKNYEAIKNKLDEYIEKVGGKHD